MNESDNNSIDEHESEGEFEKDLQKLENIVSKLERGNLSLDEAMQMYEDGIGAYKNCSKLLRNAESKVIKLVESLNGELEEAELDHNDNDNNLNL